LAGETSKEVGVFKNLNRNWLKVLLPELAIFVLTVVVFLGGQWLGCVTLMPSV
jgi:hypothetical protein